MRAIINGTRYDTEKAQLIGHTSQGNYPGDGDFRSWRAGLYKTPRSGRYFLSGEGGAMTSFAQHFTDGSRCGGEGIIVLSEADAFEWAQAELEIATVEQHFGHLIEDA